jgi:catechol 2,3-dioxygenase-like lactoylglutathione lyase family enzyme
VRLNQVTLPAIDVAASVAFYPSMGFELIVDAPHYARFKSIEGDTTFSVHKVDLHLHASQAVVYFDTSSLDETVKRLQRKGLVISQEPATNRGSGARRDSQILLATPSVSTAPVLIA